MVFVVWRFWSKSSGMLVAVLVESGFLIGVIRAVSTRCFRGERWWCSLGVWRCGGE
jgi:hypothetical protein